MTHEEMRRRIIEGQARSAKHQAYRERKRNGPFSRENKALRTIFKKGKPLSAWEKICG